MISPCCSFLNSVGFSIFKDQHGLELVYGWKKLSTWRNVPWLYWSLCYACRDQVGLLKSILISAVTFLSDLCSCADAPRGDPSAVGVFIQEAVTGTELRWHAPCTFGLCTLTRCGAGGSLWTGAGIAARGSFFEGARLCTCPCWVSPGFWLPCPRALRHILPIWCHL